MDSPKFVQNFRLMLDGSPFLFQRLKRLQLWPLTDTLLLAELRTLFSDGCVSLHESAQRVGFRFDHRGDEEFDTRSDTGSKLSREATAFLSQMQKLREAYQKNRRKGEGDLESSQNTMSAMSQETSQM